MKRFLKAQAYIGGFVFFWICMVWLGVAIMVNTKADTLTLDQTDICSGCTASFTLENARWDAVESMFNTPSIANDNSKAAAGIVYTKLNLALSIVNADISTTAAIGVQKLEQDAFLAVATTS